MWSRVAVEIANRTGRRVGEKVEDRYEALRAEKPADPQDAELRRAVQEISRGLAELTSGRGDATPLHNLKAGVLNAVDLAGKGPEICAAGDALCLVASALEAAQDENAASLAGGHLSALLSVRERDAGAVSCRGRGVIRSPARTGFTKKEAVH